MLVLETQTSTCKNQMGALKHCLGTNTESIITIWHRTFDGCPNIMKLASQNSKTHGVCNTLLLLRVHRRIDQLPACMQTTDYSCIYLSTFVTQKARKKNWQAWRITSNKGKVHTSIKQCVDTSNSHRIYYWTNPGIYEMQSLLTLCITLHHSVQHWRSYSNMCYSLSSPLQ